jgi:titin
VAVARNLISGNQGDGVDLLGSDSRGNVVEGNYIGTDAAGSAALGNRINGVLITAGATDNTIGGSTAGAANVISGNGAGSVLLSGSFGVTPFDTTRNAIRGNRIGTDATGTRALGNFGEGVHLEAASHVRIDRNIIPGNSNSGVQLDGAAFNTLTSNAIGVNAAGNAALGNGGHGVFIINTSHDNTIGGSDAGAGNIISGNRLDGISIFFFASFGNRIEGNFIGADASGTFSLGNLVAGVHIHGAASGNVIGGTSPATRNIISGNLADGVTISEAGASDNVVEGNYIGTDATGTLARGNHPNGAGIFVGASDRTTIRGNQISGNTGTDLVLASSNNGRVQGNLIGVQKNGTTPLPNPLGGIDVNASGHTTIGGTTAADRNVISGNAVLGVELDGSATTGNVLEGNLIGVGGDGKTPVPNTTLSGSFGYGVWLNAGADRNTIGGTAAGAGNVISGNAGAGVLVQDSGTTGNEVEGNSIGTKAGGTASVGNGGDGVRVQAGASSNTIGGDATGMGNTIAFNYGAGVAVVDATTTGILILGSSVLGNARLGIDLGGTGALRFNDTAGHSGPNNF